MSELPHDIVVSSRVRLARNYHDLPFNNLNNAGNAETCVTRALSAFSQAENPEEGYTLHTLRNMGTVKRMALVEQHLISKDLLQNSQVGAALVRKDEAVSVMVNEEDHLRIQAMLPGFRLKDVAALAFEAEEKLQAQCPFSFDAGWGYLTACPTNTGTGMRASLMLHLPVLTFFKQMGNVAQSVSKLGLTIRGIYGEGSEALGDLYQISNQVTLGRSEQEILETVTAVGKQLIDMEQSLRTRVMNDANIILQDRIFRSYGLLRYARQMGSKEFMEHWSHLRLGVALSLLPLEISLVDELLTIGQDAHAKLHRAISNSGLSTDQSRAEILRNKLNITPQEV